MGKIEYCRGTNEDMQDIIDFGDLVFSKAHEPHDFKTLVPKLYGPGVQSQSLHYLAKEDGKIRAMVCVMPQQMQIAGEEITVSSLGTVSVHPAQRGKGYMKYLMDMAIKDMEAEGHAFCVLSGQRQRYEYFGFVPAGQRLAYEIEYRNIKHACGDLDVSDISLGRLEREGWYLKDAYELHRESPVYCEYNEEDFYNRLTCWGTKPYAIIKGGEFIGYFLLTADKTGISEIKLKDVSMFPAVARVILQELDLQEVFVSIPVWEKELSRIIIDFCESHIQKWDACYRIMNFGQTVRGYMKLLAQRKVLQDGKLIVDIEGREKLQILVEGGEVAVTGTTAEADLCLTEEEAANLLFSPINLSSVEPKVEKLPAAVQQWLPLPLYMPKADIV